MVNKSTRQSSSTPTNEVPDPWEEDLTPQPKPVQKSWQFPLDPKHEIAAAPAPDGILSPQGNPDALQIPTHAGSLEPSLTEVLLQEELKVNATQSESLWNRIRDFFALLWSGQTASE